MAKPVLYVILLFFIIVTVKSAGDFYWRDWNGTAPYDAFLVGSHEGETIYVAQAYVKDYGLFISYVKENQTNISVSTGRTRYPPLNYSSILKVLCTQGEPFQWVYMNLDDYETVIKTYTLFTSGWSEGIDMHPEIHVGRYNESGNTFIGSIYWSFWMFYSNQTNGMYAWDFEILVMNQDLTTTTEEITSTTEQITSTTEEEITWTTEEIATTEEISTTASATTVLG